MIMMIILMKLTALIKVIKHYKGEWYYEIESDLILTHTYVTYIPICLVIYIHIHTNMSSQMTD